jgi:tryptophan 2,3-dioxygenase
MPMHERVRLLRTALDLVPGDLAPHARAVLMSDLALKLTVDSGSDEVDASNYLEGEKLTRDALDLARTHGWTDRISEELFHLTLILMALARPREALEVAADALRLDIDSPAVRAAFLIELTEAAVAVGDNALAVRSYAEASTVVEDVGASRLRQLVAAKLKFDGYDVVERLARLQGKLQPWTQAPAMTARNHAGTTSASE